MRYKTSKYSAYLERGRLSFQIRELCESYCVDFLKTINYTSIYGTIQVFLWQFVNSRIRETPALCPVSTAETNFDSASIADSWCPIYGQTWAVGRLVPCHRQPWCSAYSVLFPSHNGFSSVSNHGFRALEWGNRSLKARRHSCLFIYNDV